MKFWKLEAAALAAVLGIGGLAVVAEMRASAQDTQAPAPGRKHLYSETADQRAEITAALKQAKREHKRVILDFGGDWCPDCQVLDIYFHQGMNAELLAQHFVLVHVWIGHMDQNIDLAAEFGVPIGKGVPALAVLDENGRVLYSQKTGEFNNMRHMDVASVSDFLNRWKA